MAMTREPKTAAVRGGREGRAAVALAGGESREARGVPVAFGDGVVVAVAHHDRAGDEQALVLGVVRVGEAALDDPVDARGRVGRHDLPTSKRRAVRTRARSARGARRWRPGALIGKRASLGRQAVLSRHGR